MFNEDVKYSLLSESFPGVYKRQMTCPTAFTFPSLHACKYLISSYTILSRNLSLMPNVVLEIKTG